jgi:hypothetical protein
LLPFEDAALRRRMGMLLVHRVLNMQSIPPNYRPQPMIRTVNEAIERTPRVTGLSPKEVVAEGLVGAKRPVYAQGGLVE